jgi:chemotaxis protein histidine kinase CheA/ActR/RegA family two-component response regulator
LQIKNAHQDFNFCSPLLTLFTFFKPAMTVDQSIREQTYQYFLQEAPELLQALEQGLLHFRDHHGINQVNNLMRATHTLKGAATSVGLETIATIAHSLEDIFKALCNPEATIDPAVEALLFEGVECLRLPLVAELTGGTIDHAEILDRAAAVFAQLQEKLGDCFGQTTPLPTSADLGFDVTQSIFEVGVAQRLDQIASAIAGAQPEEAIVVLQAQVEVFLGLAESLNLSGFQAIAQATLAALARAPEQAMTIAEFALADFRAGQAAVLAGDRTQGGLPSPGLQQLAGTCVSAEQPDRSVASLNKPANEPTHSLVENIWGGQAVAIEPDLEATEEQTAAIAVIHPQEHLKSIHTSTPQASINISAALPLRDAVTPPPQVRVTIKHLEELNYSVGELLTNHNRQLLQSEQTQNTVQVLLTRLKQHKKLLEQLRDLSNKSANSTETRKQHRLKRTSYPSAKFDRKSARNSAKRTNVSQTRLDSHSGNAHLIQSLLDDVVQLTEAADAIDLFTQQSIRTLDNQQHLLTNTRSALIEARMLPLGEILNRLSSILQQLETLHHKQVVLELKGTEVLVDKVVAEKLYDPLLHLVRNAFDHGIESTVVRQQQGKPDQGKIEICAYNQGRYLVIQVQDDGKGLDFEQILQRAIEHQIISPEPAGNLDRSQLIDLLFEPGFSTASHISDLSGRGIGLDVVRNQVQALRGSVTVDSQPGKGTTFVLQIPLSLTIASLLVCEANSRFYALLDDAIEQIVIPQPSQLQERNNRKILRWGKGNKAKLVPIYSLPEVLDYGSTIAAASTTPAADFQEMKPVILLHAQETLLGLEVEQMIGEQELVIRPLGTLIGAPNYVHGASILADSQLALVIDGARLIQNIFDRQWHPPTHPTWEKPSWLLPAQPQPQMLPQAVFPALPGQAIEIGSSTKILVVEDSITTRNTIALTLQKAGYQVSQAQNGHEGLTQLQYQKDIRLVLCDLEMPVMNGFEFLRQVQQNSALAHLPILILTSRSDEDYRLLALQLGAAAYMTKPYMEHKLLVMVADLLEKTVLGVVIN